MSIHVKRKYFYAEAPWEIFVEIPLEDWEPGDEMMVAKLNLSIYGTRDAAQNLKEEYMKNLVDLGFTAGVATPCNFLREEKEVFVIVAEMVQDADGRNLRNKRSVSGPERRRLPV